MVIKIKLVSKENVDELIKLDKIWKSEKISLGMDVRTKKEFLKDIKNSICFVALINNKIIGYVLGIIKQNKKKLFYLKTGKKFLTIDSIYVLPKYRNKKVGNKLMEYLLKEAKKQKLSEIFLVADNLDADSLIRFYKKFGFGIVFAKMKLGWGLK